MRSLMGYLIAFSLAFIISGCGIGYNSLLFATKTNMGVDFDTAPPAAEISIARSEGVIEPVFENGKTLPVMASFSSRNYGFIRLFSGISSAFSTGAAAAAMTKFYHESDKLTSDLQYEGVSLTQEPQFTPWYSSNKKKVEYLQPGDVEAVYFGTTSTLGVKIEWKGVTGQYPSAVKIGFHRLELAWAPVTIEKRANTDFRVNAPSLLATVDSSVSANETGNSGLEYMQYFATGDAATNLALRRDVRQVMLKKIIPELRQEGIVLSGSDHLARLAFLSQAYEGLKEAAQKNKDLKARALADAWDQLAGQRTKFDFANYRLMSPTNLNQSAYPDSPAQNFNTFVAFFGNLSDSVGSLNEVKKLVDTKTGSITLKTLPAGTSVPVDLSKETETKPLLADLIIQSDHLQKVEEKYSKEPSILDGINYFVSLLRK